MHWEVQRRSTREKALAMAEYFLHSGSPMISVVSVIDIRDTLRQNLSTEHGRVAHLSVYELLVVTSACFNTPQRHREVVDN